MACDMRSPCLRGASVCCAALCLQAFFCDTLVGFYIRLLYSHAFFLDIVRVIDIIITAQGMTLLLMHHSVTIN